MLDRYVGIQNINTLMSRYSIFTTVALDVTAEFLLSGISDSEVAAKENLVIIGSVDIILDLLYLDS